ncbi:Uncharacterised protein [Shigella flexneri]|nr:Uncharacterised protein [Shigella flexneri]
MHAVTLEIMVRAGRAVNRNLMEIRPTKTTDLCIGIGEQTSLQQGIVGEVQTRNNMTWMECCLFVFGKEVIRIAIEHHFADTLNGHQFFRDQFGWIEKIEVELEFIFFRNQLEAQFVFRKIACFNGFPQLAAVEVRVTSGEFLCFIPNE